ncbi:MAG: ThiF family adenylyltransferase, partial [Anaerolineae bacterium]|nr:ThiF family adenylyltransferase [Anaerolineae bacterium]
YLLLPDHDTFYETLVSRSYPLVSREAQQQLRQAKIGIAGQGTVGGNLVVAMARYGFENIRTSDPDTFEVTNLNRQPCNLFTVGNEKVREVAYQAAAINPFMQIEQFEPVSAQNLESFVQGCDVVVSALDNTSLIVGLNIEARKQKVPVVLGTDVGSGILLDVFDYRQTNDLMHGRVVESDINLPAIQLIFKFLGIDNFPVEMLDALQMRMRGELDYFAQTIVSANMCSSALIKAVSFLVTGQAMRKSTAVDLLSVLLTEEDESLRQQKRTETIAALKQAFGLP